MRQFGFHGDGSHCKFLVFANGATYGSIDFESNSRVIFMRTLPVFDAFRHAIRSTIDNIGFAFHISWPWMLLMLPLNIAGNFYFISRGASEAEKFDAKNSLILLVLIVVPLIAYSSIAVNWHRYVLLDEMVDGWQRLRIDGLMWRYVGNFFAIILLIAVGAFAGIFAIELAGLIFGKAPGNFGKFVLFAGLIALYAIMIVSAYRLSVKLPAIALGRRDFTLRDAWAATDGNFWQLLGLFLLFLACALLMGVVVYVVALAFAKFGAVGLSVALAIQVVLNWIATILGVTLLTSLYGYFVEGRNF